MYLTIAEKHYLTRRLETGKWSTINTLEIIHPETENLLFVAGEERFVNFLKELIGKGEVIEKKQEESKVSIVLENDFFRTEFVDEGTGEILVSLEEIKD